jgi:hypothetical protein
VWAFAETEVEIGEFTEGIQTGGKCIYAVNSVIGQVRITRCIDVHVK